MYNTDEIYIYTRPGYRDNPWDVKPFSAFTPLGPFSMIERRALFGGGWKEEKRRGKIKEYRYVDAIKGKKKRGYRYTKMKGVNIWWGGSLEDLDESRGKISMIDLWATKERKRNCGWVARYFGIYVSKRDGLLEDLDVRKNGKTFRPSGPQTRYNYLRKAGKVPGAPDFIKRPEWFKSYKQKS